MNIANVQPNTPAWLVLRKNYDTASEAPAALGESKYTSRAALMHQKATGVTEEVGAAKQTVFDRGHRAEELARTLAEEVIGSELFPVTATLEVDGLKLLASLDGVTMDEETIWEHKLYSESLAADVRNETLAPHYTIQMDQQLLVSGAKKCLFMVSDGTKEKMAWCWYATTPAKQAALFAGWTQFRADLAAYVPQEVIAPAVAAPTLNLPAVSIQVNGQIALVDNLDKFGTALTAYIDGLNRAPETDQDFANLEDAVKRLKAAEDALDAAESGALAQTDSIDTMRRTVALHRETARSTRLVIDKLVKAEKENRRTKIISDAAAALGAHIKTQNDRARNYMPIVQANFQEVIKGLKSLDSMKDKVACELARCKIEANAIADKIQFNLDLLDENTEYGFLFPDVRQIVLKPADDFKALVTSRIAEHKAAKAREEEATRERIRTEEQAKMVAEQEASAKAERDRIAFEAAKVESIVTAPDVAPALTHTQVVQQMPATVRQAIAAAGTPEPTLKLGDISARIAPLSITAEGLRAMGFEPAKSVGASKLYHEANFPKMVAAMQQHLAKVSSTRREAVAA